MKTSCCPYCDHDHFSGEVIRADSLDLSDKAAVYLGLGKWFNKCLSCDQWSVFEEGVNHKIKKPKTRPKKNSL